MNQEQNNLNPNNFNTQGNNGIPNNQPLNNQGMEFNQQPINHKPQPTISFQQQIMQEPAPQPANTFERGNTNNQNFNSKPPKKMNLGLIIGIVVAVVVIGVVGKILLLSNNSTNNTENSDDYTHNEKNNSYINDSASNINKLIITLKKTYNQKYLIQFNENNIAKKFNCSNDKCGNEIVNIEAISQIADNSIDMELNGEYYVIRISEGPTSHEKIIKEINNSYIYYNELISCYMYYFRIDDSYILIQPINNNICSNKENALQLFDYFTKNLTFMTATINENTKELDFNSVKDNNNLSVNISDSYFVNDFIFDYVHSLGFKIKNPFDINFYSNDEYRKIDLNLNYSVNKPNLENINFEITMIDKSKFNHFKEKEEQSFNINTKKISYYNVDQSGAYMVIDTNYNYFKIKASGTYFTNDIALNSLKEVLNELLKKNT